MLTGNVKIHFLSNPYGGRHSNLNCNNYATGCSISLKVHLLRGGCRVAEYGPVITATSGDLKLQGIAMNGWMDG